MKKYNYFKKDNLHTSKYLPFFISILILINTYAFAQGEPKEPVIVTADIMKYEGAQGDIVKTEGNVIIIYQHSKLTCDKATVNRATTDAEAYGNVRLEFEKGIMKGEKLVYNFKSKSGYIVNSQTAAAPFYFSAPLIERLDENEMDMKRGYFTTCNHDKPHWRFKSKDVKMYPQDRITAKDSIFFAGKMPLLYLPSYTHNLKDRVMRVQVEPGHTKDWGTYLLTAWRYYIDEHFKGRIHVDWRERKDMAFGLDNKFDSTKFGKGLLKTYYMNERDLKRKHFYEKWTKEESPGSTEKERFRIQLRYMWDIDETSNLIAEYNRMSDENMIKDYFYRTEYEQESQPVSYMQFIKGFKGSTLSAYLRKRTNRFFSETEELPRINYDLTSVKILETPFYFKNSSKFANYNDTIAHSEVKNSVTEFDTTNGISMPFKFFIFEFNPEANIRETFYDRDKESSNSLIRTIFSTSCSMNTKFYRIFDINASPMGIEINRLRHIITPTVTYRYTHDPSVSADRLFFDAVYDSHGVFDLSLENKLQTKRGGESVDFVRLVGSSVYNLHRKGGNQFSDFLLDLEIIPYNWLRFESDSSYDAQEQHVKNVNLDLTAIHPSKRWSASAGHRYERKGGKEMTASFDYRFNPLWKFRTYQRYQFTTGELKEQEYTISRDLHCWTIDLTYNVNRVKGETFWIAFRLKAFPESEIGWEKGYHEPKTGSQSFIPKYQ